VDEWFSNLICRLEVAKNLPRLPRLPSVNSQLFGIHSMGCQYCYLFDSIKSTSSTKPKIWSTDIQFFQDSRWFEITPANNLRTDLLPQLMMNLTIVDYQKTTILCVLCQKLHNDVLERNGHRAIECNETQSIPPPNALHTSNGESWQQGKTKWHLKTDKLVVSCI
jgi:hypothetical protein